jgi:phosphatidylglycerol:prolipoprotein diacylglycerol transferase
MSSSLFPTTADHWVHEISPQIIRFTDTVGLQWYGLAYVVGFYLCYLVMKKLGEIGLGEIKTHDLPDFITATAVFGVVLGGRIGYMVLYDWDRFIAAPWMLVRIFEGGMASHGGIAGVALFLLYYAHKHKLSWRGIGDSIVVGAPLGIMTGRIANFINGELFGRVTDSSLGVKFPTEVLHEDFLKRYMADHGEPFPLEPGLQHSPEILDYYSQVFGTREKFVEVLYPRHPSQLYEALGEGLLLSLLLLAIRLKFRSLPHGILTGIFFIAYAIARIALENLREPDSGTAFIMGLTKGQFFSTFMIAVGLAFIVWAVVAKKSGHSVTRA